MGQVTIIKVICSSFRLNATETGKSTLAKILLRIIDFEGQLRVNDVDIRLYDPPDYHRHTTSVFQNFSKYNTSVRENVGFGCVELLSCRSVVENAVRLAQAETIVDALPHGLQSTLEPPGFENLSYPGMPHSLGSRHHGLSGGEASSAVKEYDQCIFLTISTSRLVAAHCSGAGVHESSGPRGRSAGI